MVTITTFLRPTNSKYVTKNYSVYPANDVCAGVEQNPNPVFPSFPAFPSIPTQDNKPGAIAGGVVGGVALIGIIVGVLFWIRRRHPKPKASKHVDTECIPVNNQHYRGETQQQGILVVQHEIHTPQQQAYIPPTWTPQEVDGKMNEVHEMRANAIHEMPGTRTHQ